MRPDGAWEADIPATDGVRDRFEALWNAAGERLARARFPKTGYTNVLDVAQTAITNVVDGKKSVVYEQRMKLQPPMAAVFANISPAALAAVEFGCNHNWTADIRRPCEFEQGTGTLILRGDCSARHNPWGKKSLYYVENAPNALTEPGEWLYDAVAGKVRYLPRPGETPAPFKVGTDLWDGDTFEFFLAPGSAHIHICAERKRRLMARLNIKK